MSLKSDEIFNLIAAYLSIGEGEEVVKKVQAVYQFDILEKKEVKLLKPGL